MNAWMTAWMKWTKEWMNLWHESTNDNDGDVLWEQSVHGLHLQFKRTAHVCILLYVQNPAVQFGKAELQALSPVFLGETYSTKHPSSACKRSNQVHLLSSHMSRQGACTTRIASRCGWVARRCLFRTGDPYKFDYNTWTHMSICKPGNPGLWHRGQIRF